MCRVVSDPHVSHLHRLNVTARPSCGRHHQRFPSPFLAARSSFSEAGPFQTPSRHFEELAWHGLILQNRWQPLPTQWFDPIWILYLSIITYVYYIIYKIFPPYSQSFLPHWTRQRQDALVDAFEATQERTASQKSVWWPKNKLQNLNLQGASCSVWSWVFSPRGLEQFGRKAGAATSWGLPISGDWCT